MVVGEVVGGDQVVVFGVFLGCVGEIVVDFYVFDCVDVYQCSGQFVVEFVVDWFVLIWWYVIGDDVDVCVD